MRTTKVRAGAVLICLTLGVSACGGGGGSTTTTGATGKASGTITLWARDSEKAFINVLADAYNKNNGVKVKVTIVPSGNFVQKLGTAASSGSGPDVASIDLVYLPYFASKGVLEDITEVANSLPYKDSLSQAHRKLATYNGKTYALPFTAEASVMFYNKDLFKQAGLNPNKPPTTYAEMLTAARAIHKLGPDTYGFTFAGSCGGCNIFEFAPHVWASGGDVLSADGKKAMLNSPQVTDALNFYHTMVSEGLVPPSAKTDSGVAQPAAFQSGKVGMVNLGAFFVGTLVGDKKVNFGLAPIPGATGGTASFAGGDEIAVTQGSQNKVAATDFVKWATSEEAQTILAKAGIVPVRTDLLDKIYVPLDPRYKALADALRKGRTPYSVVENAVFNDNNGAWSKMINQAVFGGNAQAAQAQAQQAAQQILDRG